MEKANRTFPIFIAISCAIHGMFWFGQYELLTPVHTTGSNNNGNPIQITLIKPKQEAPATNNGSKQRNPPNNKTKKLEKSQPPKQVMVALKTNSDAKIQNSEKKLQIMVNTITTTDLLRKSLKPTPSQNNTLLQANVSKVKNIITEPNTSSSNAETKTLSQQQVARINAHLNQAFDQYFSYPRLAQRNGWQGMVKLGLRIEANGQLSNIRLLSTSGFPVLDEAALNALNRVSTLQDVDAWLDGLHLDTILPVQYKLVDS